MSKIKQQLLWKCSRNVPECFFHSTLFSSYPVIINTISGEHKKFASSIKCLFYYPMVLFQCYPLWPNTFLLLRVAPIELPYFSHLSMAFCLFLSIRSSSIPLSFVFVYPLPLPLPRSQSETIPLGYIDSQSRYNRHISVSSHPFSFHLPRACREREFMFY